MNTYILLSSFDQVYKVETRSLQSRQDTPQVEARFCGESIPKLGHRHTEQLEYALKSAVAAHAALSPLDWHYKVGAQLSLTPLLGDALVFEAGSNSNSVGLGYALALHVAFRRKLGKHLPATMPVVFATGKVESSGVVEKIGHLATKLQGAFNCAQSRHAGGSFVVYYPKANEADVSDEHHAQAKALSGRLVAVSCVGEALLDLLGETYDGDSASRLEPFKGLASFDFSDQFFFFGREEALSRLREDYARYTGLLVVTGSSGAGKSSLIKAGLLPALRNTNPSLRYSITQPKQHESLIALLQSLLDSDYAECTVTAKDLLNQDKEAEATFITYAKAQPATFWYLDQFEEAANLFGEELESSQFTATLHRLASAIPNLSIVASVRSEYVSCIRFLPNQSPVSPTIPPHGFQSIIVNQAKKFGLWYEIGLVDRLVEDATTIQHALPALEYMLLQMNEKRKQQVPEGFVLTHAHYDELGGLKGGITQQLETILQAHDRQSDEFFEHAIGLNETGQLYARSLIKEQIPTHLQPLIHALIDKQLLIGWQTEQGTRLRLAHDSLLQTSWPRLKAWLEPESSTSRKGYLQWLEHNWGDFQKWSALKDSEQAKEYLLTRNNLIEGNVHLTAANLIQRQDVRNYISASQVHQQEKERLETKKQRRRVGVFVSIALVAILAAGWAYIKQQEAIEERNRAEALLSKVRESITYLSFDLREVLTKYAPSDARVKLSKQVESLNQVLQEHAASGQSDNDLRKYAASLIEKADVIQLNDTQNATEALKLYQQAHEIFEKLSHTHPNEAQLQSDMSLSHNKIGAILQVQGDLLGALKAYRAGMAIAEKLIAQDPNCSQWQRDASVSHNKIGAILQAQGDLTGALKAYQASVTIREKLAAVDPSNPQWQRDVSISHDSIGAILQAQGELPGALKAYKAGMTIREKLTALDTNNTEWQRDVWVSHSQIGAILQVQGDHLGALKAYRAGMAIAEKLTALDPNNTEWQRDVSISHLKIGAILQVQGDLPGALKSYRAGMVIHENLVALGPNNTQWIRDQSALHDSIAAILQAQGDLRGALKAYQTGMAIREKLTAMDPSNSEWRRDVSVSHSNIGGILEAQGDHQGALQAYQASMAILEKLIALDPNNTEWQRDMGISLSRMGDILLLQGHSEDALKSYQASRLIHEKLAMLDSINTEWQRDVSVSHDKIGAILQAQGDLTGALKAYQASVTIREKLAAVDPSNPQWQRDLSISHDGVGDILKAEGDFMSALKVYKASLMIREKLGMLDLNNAVWQRDISISHQKIGSILQAQDDLTGALKAYQASLKIREKLAMLDRSNTEVQRDVSASHVRIGDILQAQGDLTGALKAYQISLTIRENLTMLDPNIKVWQRDFLVSNFNVGKVFALLGDKQNAAKKLEAALNINRTLLESDSTNTLWQRDGEMIQGILKIIK